MSTTITRDITAQVDGITTVFDATAVYIDTTLVVERNGVRLRPGDDFNETVSPDFEMTEPPKVGDTLQVQFEVLDQGGGPGSVPIVIAHAVDPTI